jgi:hypothetical protein
MPAFISAAARTGIGIMMLPLSATIDRYIFRKNGPNIGTIILLFIFVNAYWMLPVAAYYYEEILRNVYPPAAFLGREAATALIIFLGNYFYWLPIGCFIYLLLFLKRNHLNKGCVYVIYKMFQHLLVITPAAAAVYTLISYKILYVFNYIPHRVSSSFFYPDNLYSFFQFYFPFMRFSDYSGFDGFISVYGAFAGLAGSVKVWKNEIASGKRLYRDRVKEYLSGRDPRYYGIFVVYPIVLFFLILQPLINYHSLENGEIVVRLISYLLLLLPLTFGMAVRICCRLCKCGF